MARYSIYVEKEQGLDRTTLKINHNGIPETKFDLEVIDRYTSQFKDQNDLLTYLTKTGILENFVPKRFFIGYADKGKILEKDIIYNDKTIYNAAKDIIAQKRQRIDSQQIVLTETPEITHFINTIINLGVNNYEAINSMHNSPLFPEYIYLLLQNYKEPNNNNFIQPSNQNDKAKIRNQINYKIKIYKYFRSIYLWKKQYEKDLEDSPETEYIKNIYRNYGLEGVKNLFDNDYIGKHLTPKDIKEMSLYSSNTQESENTDNMRLK